MSNSKGISPEEYLMLRNELDGCIEKQEDLHNAIYTILGLSIAFYNWIDNVLFLIAIMMISAVLLSRIIHYRNAVYYLSAYLSSEQALSCFKWEKRINNFKKKIYGKDKSKRKKRPLIHSVIKSASVVKYFGNIILCGFVFAQIIILLLDSDGSLPMKITFFVVAVVSLLFNLVFTIVICFDKKVKDQYIEVWDEILEKD